MESDKIGDLKTMMPIWRMNDDLVEDELQEDFDDDDVDAPQQRIWATPGLTPLCGRRRAGGGGSTGPPGTPNQDRRRKEFSRTSSSPHRRLYRDARGFARPSSPARPRARAHALFARRKSRKASSGACPAFGYNGRALAAALWRRSRLCQLWDSWDREGARHRQRRRRHRPVRQDCRAGGSSVRRCVRCQYPAWRSR